MQTIRIWKLLKQVEKQAEESKEDAQSLSFGQKVFSRVGRACLSTPGQILVLLMAAALLGGGVYGTTQLQQATNPFLLTLLSCSGV